MSPENLKYFMDHYFIVVFPFFFAGSWFLVAAAVSSVGGWYALSNRYRTRIAFDGAKWKMQSGQMRRFMNYNNVLTLGANGEGLYLACMFLFRFMHPPLFVPWREIKVRRSKGLFFEYVTFIMDAELAIPLKVRAGLAGLMRNEAGAGWPVEEI
jgi:hypothetical protein